MPYRIEMPGPKGWQVVTDPQTGKAELWATIWDAAEAAQRRGQVGARIVDDHHQPVGIVLRPRADHRVVLDPAHEPAPAANKNVKR